MKVTDKFVFFWDGEFSNFHPAKFNALCPFDGILKQFNCSEQYFMYNKAFAFNDNETADKILAETHPYKQKKLGRIVKGFDQEYWATVCEQVMYNANFFKYDENKALREILLATGDKILVEASPYDKIWGIGMAEDHPDIEDMSKWKGQNLLGQALMKVRKQFRQLEYLND
jgi:ribA/ribD-fused uncharacterized protein